MDYYFYKNIVYRIYCKFELLEFDFFKNNICSQKDYIIKMSVLSELIGYKRPHYVLIDKRNNDFTMNNKLYEFNRNLLKRSNIDYGVKNIFILVPNNKYAICRRLNLIDTMVFKHFESIIEYIGNR